MNNDKLYLKEKLDGFFDNLLIFSGPIVNNNKSLRLTCDGNFVIMGTILSIYDWCFFYNFQ